MWGLLVVLINNDDTFFKAAQEECSRLYRERDGSYIQPDYNDCMDEKYWDKLKK